MGRGTIDAEQPLTGHTATTTLSKWWSQRKTYVFAALLALGGYVLAFAVPIAGQFPLSTAGSAAADQSSVPDYAFVVTFMMATGLAGGYVSLLALHKLPGRAMRTRAVAALRPNRNWWWPAFIPFTVLWASQAVAILTGWMGVGGKVNNNAVWYSFFAAADAGITEEIIVLAVPATVMLAWIAFTKRPIAVRTWVLMLLLLTALRMSYHLYYGVQAVVLVPWAIASALTFFHWRAVAPMIVMHTLYDFGAFLLQSGQLTPTLYLAANAAVLAFVFAGALVARLAPRR